MWYNEPFLALDTETTGLNWDIDRVIQLGVSHFDAGKCLQTREYLLNTGYPSAPEAVATHGITDEMQAKGDNPADVLWLLKRWLRGYKLVVIMNAPFDLNFLITEYRRLGQEPLFITERYYVDPLVIDRFYSKNRIPPMQKGARTLKALSERFGVHDYPLHSAGHDSRRVGELAIEIARRYGQVARAPLSELSKRQRKWHKEWCDSFSSFADQKGFQFMSTEWPHSCLMPRDSAPTLPNSVPKGYLSPQSLGARQSPLSDPEQSL